MKQYILIPKDKYERVKAENEELKNKFSSAEEFVHQIASGNFEADYDTSGPSNDLTTALRQLRDHTAKLYSEEKQRSWVNEGLAKFSEILRIHHQNSINEIFLKIIRNLVPYLGANQGAIFVLRDQAGEQSLDLVSCYAYDKRKFITRTVAIGEGLVGQCFIEKDIIYMTQIPENYIKITSGLGEALPRSLLLVPLLNDNTIVGVIELASFHEFESFQVNFIRKVAEGIASAYSNMLISDHTKQLLDESRLQAEALKSNEEEMRQNMEELTASQEELRRIQLETDAQNKIFNSMAIVSRTDAKGNITAVNEEFVKWSKYSREEVLGMNHRILKSGHQDDGVFKELWETISAGRIWRGEVKNRAKDGTYYWVDAIIAPILDKNGKPKEYISQRMVINDKKEKEEKMRVILQDTQAKEEELRQNMEELQAQQEELQRIHREIEAQTSIINSTAIVSRTDARGNITYVNDEFVKWSKYDREEVIGKNHRILKSGHQSDDIFTELWKTISVGRIWRGEVKNKGKDGSYYWVDAIIAPVLDAHGKPKEYIAQRFVINEKKTKEEQMNKILAETEAQTRIINSLAIVSKTDLKGNITYVNEQFVKWSKYLPDEVIGKNHRILKSGHQPDEVFEDLWKTISHGKIWRGEVKNKAKDGSFYWVDAIVAPVLDADGKPKEYIAQRFIIKEGNTRGEK